MKNKINFIKGLAIIGVIVVHTMPIELITKLQLAFTFNQQVPIFLIISGITFTLSFDRKKIFEKFCLKEYSVYIKEKLKKIIIPIGIIYMMSTLIYIILNKKSYGFGIENLIFRLPAEGPGNYYILLLIQLIIVMPIAYYCFNKNNNKTVIIMFFMNILMETVFYKFNVFNSYYIYKSCILRYFGIIALGMLIASNLNNKIINKKTVIFLAPFSAIYIWSVNNFDFKFKWIYENSWHHQNVISFFYTAILFSMLFKYIKINFNNIVHSKILWLGTNSFYIFLAQVIYFSAGLSILDIILMKILKFESLLFIYLMTTLVDIFLCCILAKYIIKMEKLIYRLKYKIFDNKLT